MSPGRGPSASPPLNCVASMPFDSPQTADRRMRPVRACTGLRGRPYGGQRLQAGTTQQSVGQGARDRTAPLRLTAASQADPGRMAGNAELGKRRSLRSLFSVDLHSVNGTVLDLQEGVPLAGATVYLRSPDESKEPLECHTLADGTFSIQEVPPGTWHTVVALETGSVLLEVKAGPFIPDQPKEFAAWAPEEGSDEAREYHSFLLRLVSQHDLNA